MSKLWMVIPVDTKSSTILSRHPYPQADQHLYPHLGHLILGGSDYQLAPYLFIIHLRTKLRLWDLGLSQRNPPNFPNFLAPLPPVAWVVWVSGILGRSMLESLVTRDWWRHQWAASPPPPGGRLTCPPSRHYAPRLGYSSDLGFPEGAGSTKHPKV